MTEVRTAIRENLGELTAAFMRDNPKMDGAWSDDLERVAHNMEALVTFGEPLQQMSRILAEDSELRYGWQSGIAATLHDRYEMGFKEANEAAKVLLVLLFGPEAE